MEYTGKFKVGDVIVICGERMNHECEITNVWNDGGVNGVTVVPTGGYGFEMDVREDRLLEMEAV